MIVCCVGNHSCCVLGSCCYSFFIHLRLTWRVTCNTWCIVCSPFTSCPVTVSNFASYFIDTSCSSQLSSLCCCSCFTVWSCDLDRSSNRLIKIICFDSVKCLSRIIRQLSTISLWMFWINGYIVVSNCNFDWFMTISAKRQFTWHLTFRNRPTSWNFRWDLNCLVGYAINSCCVDSLP